MKFICYTNEKRLPIWWHLTANIRHDPSVQISFFDTESGKKLPGCLNYSCTQDDFKPAQSPVTPEGKSISSIASDLDQIVLVDSLAKNVAEMRHKLSALKSASQNSLTLAFMRFPFDELVHKTNSSLPRLHRIMRQALYADAIVVDSEATAEVLRCHWSGPVIVMLSSYFDQVPEETNDLPRLTGGVAAFTQSLISLIDSAKVWKPIKNVCQTVSEELRFLGISAQSEVIGEVSAHLQVLLPPATL